MGLFGNKQQDDSVYQTDEPAQTAMPSAPASTDGFMPTQTPDPSGTSAPMLDEHLHDDDGGYIMAEPPVSQQPVPAAEPDTATENTVDEPPVETAPPEAEPVPVTTSTPAAEPAVAEEPSPAAPQDNNTLDDLAAIKEKALRDLSPLVAHLDQSPEEKFRTTLMLLQTTDDKSLIKAAYEAAQSITDDKARAQALLEVVQEIEYLTNK